MPDDRLRTRLQGLTPGELVVRGLRIVPVYCIVCGAQLEQAAAEGFLCGTCCSQEGALIDRARYCTVCGREKTSAGEQWVQTTSSSMVGVVLCWPHNFAYTKERDLARSALSEWVRQELAVALAQQGSAELRQVLTAALEELTSWEKDLLSLLLSLDESLGRLASSPERAKDRHRSREQHREGHP